MRSLCQRLVCLLCEWKHEQTGEKLSDDMRGIEGGIPKWFDFCSAERQLDSQLVKRNATSTWDIRSDFGFFFKKNKNLAVFSQKNPAHHYGWEWEHGLPQSNEKFRRDWRGKLPSRCCEQQPGCHWQDGVQLSSVPPTDRLQLRFPVTLSVFILCACTHTRAAVRAVTHR